MISYIDGKIVHKQPEEIIIDYNGIGFAVQTAPGTTARIAGVGEVCRVWTHLYVREDQMTLYGFSSPEEVSMFRLLMTVSGIGPKVGSNIVGDISPSRFALAVLAGDVKTLTQVKGVGKKVQSA